MRGKPVGAGFVDLGEAEHPRVCGENGRFLALAKVLARNIPAYAGKTWIYPPPHPWPAEHPRVCGENLSTLDQAGNGQGTSPRMRGKRFNPRTLWDGPRNIPAHAGKTVPQPTLGVAAQEHPRACGENSTGAARWPPGRGTSPRMRGKPDLRLLQLPYGRNIPAHAGKTLRNSSGFAAHQEHPRACGENLPNGAAEIFQPGTSPRMRGKPAGEISEAPIFRNIPAHAGKTLTDRSTYRGTREHPRACGENITDPAFPLESLGTSPRMRGKL